MFQVRQTVNHFFFLFIEFPHFLRNFTEDHSDPPGDVRTAFDDNPIRIGVNARELVYPNVWLRLKASTTNNFTIRQEMVETGDRVGSEQGKVTDIEGYLEYVFDPNASLSEQSAAGIGGAYLNTDKRRGGIASPCSLCSLEMHTGGPAWSFGGAKNSGFADKALYRQATQSGIEETSPFTATEEDSVRAWRVERYFARPFLWMVLSKRTIVHAAIRFEKGELKWRNDKWWETKIKSWNTIPSVGVQYHLGRRKASIVEAVFSAQYRKREESIMRVSGVQTRDVKKFRDQRISLVYEYRFSPTRSVRIIETIDLNHEDWGQFSIHDHGFFQILIGF
jgi:hypothetical protein